MKTLKVAAVRGFEYYKQKVSQDLRKEVRLRFMHKACANMTLVRILNLTPYKEPEFSGLISEFKLIPEDDWRGE